MTTLAALWLPIVLSAVFVFIVSSVIHMVLPIHKSDFQKLTNEADVLAALRNGNLAPGAYMFPCPASMKDMASPEMMAKYKQGPVGSMIVGPNGPMNMGKALGMWFVYCLVVGVFCAYLAGLALAPGAAAMRVFQITGAVAMLGHFFSHVHEWTWKNLPTSVVVKFAFDGAVYTLVTAATFAWLWPSA